MEPPCDWVHSGTWIIAGDDRHDGEIGSGSADDESGDISIVLSTELCFISWAYFQIFFCSPSQWRYKDKVGTFTVHKHTCREWGNLFFSATNTHSDFPFRLAARATIHFLNPPRKRKAQLSICLLNFKIIFLFCLSPCNITWQKRALRLHAPRTRPYTTKLKLVLKTLRNEREREARVARESEKQPESGPIVRAEKFQEISNCEDFSLFPYKLVASWRSSSTPSECRSSSSLSSRHTTQAGYRMIHFAKCWPWIGQRTARCPMPACFFIHEAYKEKCFFGEINYSR